MNNSDAERSLLSQDWFRHLTVLLLLSLAYYAMNPGYFTGWSTGYIGASRGDTAILIYLESVTAHRFFSWPSIGFDLPIFFPYKRALGYSDCFLLPGLIAKGFLLFTDNEMIVFNLILVLTAILNGFCAYLLAFKLTSSRPASFCAGFVFMCFPFFVLHRAHPQLQFGFWIPLTLLGVITFAERRTITAASSIGACVAGAFFCSAYYGMYSYLLAAVALGAYALLRPITIRPRDILVLTLANLPWILLLLPAVIPYMQVRAALGANPMQVLKARSPGLSAFIAAPNVAELWAPYTQRLSNLGGFLFFGFVPLTFGFGVMLATWMDIQRMEKHERTSRMCRWLTYLIAIILLSGIARVTYFELRPSPHTLNHVIWAQTETLWGLLIATALLLVALGWRQGSRELTKREWIALLAFLAVFFVFATLGIRDAGGSKKMAPHLYRSLILLPGFDALRGLCRMGIVVVTLFGTLTAIGLAALLSHRWFLNKRRAALLVGSFLALVAIELHTRYMEPATAHPRPKIYEQVKDLPTQEPIVGLPIQSNPPGGKNSRIWNSLYMLWMRDANNPLVNGFSGKAPSFHNLVAYRLDAFPSPQAMSVLGTLVGVRYVVVNSKFYGEETAKRIHTEAIKYPETIQTIKCDASNNCLYRVQPIIDTTFPQSSSFLVTPDRRTQTLRFEIQAHTPSTSSSEPIEVRFSINTSPEETVWQETVPLRSPSEWQEVTLHLPPCKRFVKPTPVAIKVTGAKGARIRNITLTPSAAPSRE